MPSSFYDALSLVVPFVMDLHPRSILDVGIGFGKYGFLFREYLDIDRAESTRSTIDRTGWTVRIDGIEAHAPYVTEIQRSVYDTIYVGDALDLLPRLGPYDLIFASDVLEHFDPADGRRFLEAARARSTIGVLVLTPAVHFHQAESFGNPREVHRSFWTAADLAAYPDADVLVWRRQLIAVLPAAGRRLRLPRPTVREAAGIVVRWAAARIWGETGAEVRLDRWRRRGTPGPHRDG